MTYYLKTFPDQDYILKAKKAKGHRITDEHNNQYLDLTAGGTSFALIGYGNEIIEKAIIDQLRKFSHLDCKTFEDQNRETLSEILINSSNAFKNCKRKVFFSGGSGAEAIEKAMHMSFQWHKENGHSKKKWFLSRNQSYHGATSGALSIGERPNLEFYRPLQSKYRSRVSECNYKKNKFEEETEIEYTDRIIQEFENKISEIGSDNICAFIGETMLGGLVGDVPPTKNYWKRISEICKRNNIHLILDEIWCGTGVSGKFHCFEYDDVVPEFLVLGKSLGCGYIPLSAVIVDKKFNDAIKKGSGRIEMSCTFQAHSVAIASAIAVQKIITSDGYIENVFKKGKYIRKTLREHLGSIPIVKDIRGRGVRNTLEYETANNQFFSKLLSEKMFNKRIIMSCKWHRASFSHAMSLEMKEIDYYLEAFCSSFKELSTNPEITKNMEFEKKLFF